MGASYQVFGTREALVAKTSSFLTIRFECGKESTLPDSVWRCLFLFRDGDATVLVRKIQVIVQKSLDFPDTVEYSFLFSTHVCNNKIYFCLDSSDLFDDSMPPSQTEYGRMPASCLYT